MLTSKEINEVYMSMPDYNRYLDDDHEKLEEAFSEWIAKHYYAVSKIIEDAHSKRNQS